VGGVAVRRVGAAAAGDLAGGVVGEAVGVVVRRAGNRLEMLTILHSLP
jgi:hypothetical protein